MKVKNIVMVASISALVFMSSVQADQQGFTIGAGANSLDLADSANSASELGYNLGYQFAGPLAIEASHIDFDGGVSHTAYDLLYNFVDNRKYALFASLGAGENDFAGTTEDFTALGLGIKGYMTDNVAVRAGLKAMDADVAAGGRDGTDVLTTIGLEYNFGSYDKQAAKAVAAKPATPVAKPVTGPKDSDNDGVLDWGDQCPNTPAGIKVDGAGCEVDSDNDGVVDSKDQCNNTQAGAKVNAVGCYVLLKEAKQIELKVNFPTNSNKVLPQYYSEIASVATFMKQYPNTRVVVEGHTDSRGSAAYNKSLSQKRASMIAAILVEQYGVSKSRVSAKGYGEERPIASNDTKDGRAANRRVVAVINTIVEKIAK